MSTIKGIFAAVASLTLLMPTIAEAQAPGRITGVGGIFVTSKDPKALAAWYRDVLGIPLEKWGGAVLRYDAPGHPAMVLWNVMPTNSEEIAPSKRDYMINFAVDDIGAFLDRLKTKGVPILKRDDTDPFGKFAWIMDPDGTKIELWQPKPNRHLFWHSWNKPCFAILEAIRFRHRAAGCLVPTDDVCVSETSCRNVSGGCAKRSGSTEQSGSYSQRTASVDPTHSERSTWWGRVRAPSPASDRQRRD